MKQRICILLFLLCIPAAAQAQHRKARIAALQEPVHLYDSQVEPGTGNIVSVGYEIIHGQYHPLLLKTDRHGNRIWAKILAEFAGLAGTKVRITANGDYIVVVPDLSAHFFRSDSAGNLLASAQYGFWTTVNRNVTGITELPNGNIVICGFNDFEHQNTWDGYLSFLSPLGTVIKTVVFTAGPSQYIQYNFNDVAVHNNHIVVAGSYNGSGLIVITDLDGNYPVMRATAGGAAVGGTTYGPVYFTDIRSVGGNLYVNGMLGNGQSPVFWPVQVFGRLDTATMTISGSALKAPGSSVMNNVRFSVRDTGSYWFAYQPSAPVVGGQTMYDATIGRVDGGAVTYSRDLHEDSSLAISGFALRGDTLFLSGATQHRNLEQGYLLRLQTADPSPLCGLSSHAIAALPVSMPTGAVGADNNYPFTFYHSFGSFLNDTAYEMHVCGAAPCRPIQAHAHAQTPTTVCYGEKVRLKATHNYNTSWYRNGQLVADGVDTLVTGQAGTYLAVANNGLCYDTAAPIVITVRPPVVPLLTQSGDSLLAPAYYGSYQWVDRFGADVPGETQRWLRPLASDSFQVRVTDSNGCRGISATKWFEKPTVVGESALEAESIRLYPNPAAGFFTVAAPVLPLTVQLHSLQGQLIWQTSQTTASARYSTAALGLRPGVYLIRFSAGGRTAHRRLVVQ